MKRQISGKKLNNKVSCQICSYECKNYNSLAKHLQHQHQMKSQEYYNKYLLKENKNICTNPNCTNTTRFIHLGRGYKEYCSRECYYKDPNYVNPFKDKKHKKEDLEKGVATRMKNGSYVTTQATKDKISKALKGKPHYWGVSGTTGTHESAETKLKQSIKALESYKNGRIPSNKDKKMSPDFCKKISESRIKFFENGGETWIKGLTKETSKSIRDASEIISRKALQRSADNLKKYGTKEPPEFTKKRIKASLAVVCKRPNHFEADVGEYLEELFPSRFEYVGNGSVLINGRSPDYIDKENKIVVLCHGLYWHLLRYELKDTPENKRSIELKDSEPFLKAGYDAWFIWELAHKDKKYDEKIFKYSEQF